MKNVMILIILIFIGNTLFAQDEVEQFSNSEERQIGLNATNFFLRFVSFNQGLEGTPTILLLYKKGSNGKKWRYGLGGKINWENRENNNDFSSQEFDNGGVSLAFNFGREYYKSISNKWQVHVGWETLYQAGYSKSKNYNSRLEDKVTQKNSSFNLGTGAKILAGVQFRLNRHLSLLTETGYGAFFSYGKGKSLTQFEGQNEGKRDSERENYSFRTFFNPPISLILNYHF